MSSDDAGPARVEVAVSVTKPTTKMQRALKRSDNRPAEQQHAAEGSDVGVAHRLEARAREPERLLGLGQSVVIDAIDLRVHVPYADHVTRDERRFGQMHELFVRRASGRAS